MGKPQSKSRLAAAFADNLVRERAKAKLSQEALAEAAGLSTSYISMLERGQRSPPLDTLEDIAAALDLAPVKLLAQRGA